MQQASTLTAPGAIPRYVNRRVHITLATAAVLWGMYSAYTLFFSPLFAPRITLGPGQDPVDPYVLPGNQPEERRQAEQYLSSQPWAAEPKGYHFRTDSGFFYFKNWDNQVDNGRKVRFKPFAMIWRPKGHDPQKPPYTIVSESAVVEFTSKFEMSNPNPGRIIGGALEGDVQVRGPDGLSIDGQQFYFGEQVQRVWSDHAIRFHHGPHSGKASGVELDLIAHPNPNAVETLAITGVRTVRLRKAVEMKLVPATKPDEKPSEPVHVDCQGAFEYDVANYIATFEQNVRVRQATGPDQTDRLNCDTLTLVFERDETGKGTAADPGAAPQQASANSFEARLKFLRLLAEGAVVTVSSQRSEMQGWMKSLTYDEQDRTIVLKDDPQVRLLQKNNEVLCPEITAVLDEQKKQIERVECRGSGQLYQYARDTDQNIPTSKKRREVSAKWQRKLNKAPDPATGLDLIELEGRAELQRVGEMSLEADVIGIWVTRGTGRIDRDLGAAGDDSIQPKKLLALRDVRFASPQIGGRTDHLAVWFEEGRLPPAPPGGRKVSDASIPATDVLDAPATDSKRATIVVARPQSEAIVRGQSSAGPQATPTERATPTGAAAARRPGLATIDDSPAGARGSRQSTGRGKAAAAPTRPGSKPERNANPKLAKKPRDHGDELPAGDANAR
ncbi:MAG: hypothetical protein HY290_23675, partial [Planctomycetia bacterium]|nr:hypothetical protein [Planctomycetia bacterium]